MPYKIITHNGKAHLDELLGSALLAHHLGEEPETIERIDSKDAAAIVSEARIPPDTWFIDCGLAHDSARKLYDHHQDRETDSSALLLFNDFFPELEGTDLHRYIQLVSRVDNKGIMSLDDYDNLGESRDYFSISHGMLLRAFEKDPALVLKIVVSELDDMIKFEHAKAEANLWLKDEGNVEIVKVAGLNVLRYLVVPPEELIVPLRSCVSSLAEEEGIMAVLSMDKKQPEMKSLYRADPGHEIIDLSRSKPEDIIFQHPGGFLLKFIPSNDDEWIRLIKEAIV